MPAISGHCCSERRSWDGQRILVKGITAADYSSDLRFWVELRGFEPLAPSMRTRCATGLRYSPKNGCQRSKLSGLLARLRVPPRSRTAQPCPGDTPMSVADGAYGGVRVLVVELVVQAG